MVKNTHQHVTRKEYFLVAREARLWQEIPLMIQFGAILGAPSYTHTSTPLLLYNTNPFLLELELKRKRFQQMPDVSLEQLDRESTCQLKKS